MWRWLKRGTNQKTLTMVGSAIAAVAVAGWAVYAHFYPANSGSTKPAIEADGGVAAGGDIKVGGDVKIYNQESNDGEAE